MDPAQVAALLDQQRMVFEAQMTQLTNLITNTRVSQQQAEAEIANLQAAAARTTPISGGSELRQQIRSVVDPRILERVRDFSGRDEDFAEWHVRMCSLAELLGLGDEMRVACSEPYEATMDMGALPDEECRDKARALYHILLQACSGKAMTIVRAVPEHNGLVAWRRLINEYRPEVASRHNAMLMALLTPAFVDRQPLMAQMSAWELSIVEYQRAISKSFEDSTKVAVLTRWAPESLRSQVIAIAARTDGDFHRMKAELHSMETAGRNFNALGVSGGQSNEPVPMEIGKLDAATAKCYNCGRKGHFSRDCWSKSGGKGKKGSKGKGDGKLKGKAGAGQSKGVRFQGALQLLRQRRAHGEGLLQETAWPVLWPGRPDRRQSRRKPIRLRFRQLGCSVQHFFC